MLWEAKAPSWQNVAHCQSTSPNLVVSNMEEILEGFLEVVVC